MKRIGTPVLRRRSARGTRRHPAQSRWSERGAAAVEMAFVLPVLLFLVFAIIDFGRMLNAQITLTEAAREGARAAAFNQNANNQVQAAAGTLTGVSTTVNTACPANASLTDNATVTATYTFTFITPVPGLASLLGGTINGTKTMTGKGVMPCRT